MHLQTMVAKNPYFFQFHYAVSGNSSQDNSKVCWGQGERAGSEAGITSTGMPPLGVV